MKKDDQAKVGRRGFLKALGGGAGAAAVAAVGGAAVTPAEATESNTEKRKARYQANSAHVQAFYRTNRY